MDLDLFSDICNRILEIGNGHIEFIVLFGSQARGNWTTLSDIDIAIKTDIENKDERWELRILLAAEVGDLGNGVDIVFVEDVDWTMRYHIMMDGKILFERNEAWPDFVEQVIKYYPDYKIFEENFLNETLGNKLEWQ
ncbi:MAG: type VII toxin-antitoxin system MntA family adenylyltransferase antitoxin [Candidatus Thorarchaeota archaeon]